LAIDTDGLTAALSAAEKELAQALCQRLFAAAESLPESNSNTMDSPAQCAAPRTTGQAA
jgi:hypothetical protein